MRNISGKYADFTYSSSGEDENISDNQRLGQPSWISNCFKKIQHFFKTTRGTNVISLVAGQLKM